MSANVFATFVEVENTVPVTIPALLLKVVSPSVNDAAVDDIESALPTLATITSVTPAFANVIFILSIAKLRSAGTGTSCSMLT